eukprot:TRINITY_DN45343_c0_g1_i1.p1 TRINITY_DN45343_c0_g1~~TRINITY_DN45343_c0_g1_i1.p1  ORF type:complete len:452 (+),score=106.98 TRINITY_DN45343_c0_g1_i1:96-1451(+)
MAARDCLYLVIDKDLGGATQAEEPSSARGRRSACLLGALLLGLAVLLLLRAPEEFREEPSSASHRDSGAPSAMMLLEDLENVPIGSPLFLNATTARKALPGNGNQSGARRVSLDEGFEMLEKRRRAGLSPVHEKFRRMELFEDDAIYKVADEAPQEGSGLELGLTLAKCAIVLYEASLALMSIGAASESASRWCYDMKGFDNRICGASISSVLSNTAWMTSYLFYAPAFCGVQDIAASWCGGDMAWLFGNTGEVTAAALASSVDCKRIPFPKLPPFEAPILRRRLSSAEDPAPPPEDEGEAPLKQPPMTMLNASRRLRRKRSGRPTEIVACAIIINRLITIATNQAANGLSTTKVCGALRPDTPPDIKGLCGAGIMGMMGAIPAFTAFSSRIAGACPKKGRFGLSKSAKDAYCVGDVTGMVALMFSYGAWAGTITYDCKDLSQPGRATTLG